MLEIVNDAAQLCERLLVADQLVPMFLHLVLQLLNLTSSVVSLRRQQVAVYLQLFAQVFHHLRNARLAESSYCLSFHGSVTITT